jgi:hypothetical protein
MGNLVFDSQYGKMFFSSLKNSDWLWVSHSLSYSLGTRGSFPRGKKTDHEDDHLPSSNGEVKKEVKRCLNCPLMA